MPKYKFKAKKMDGEEIEDVREAEDEFALGRDLRKENFILIDFEEEGKKRKFDLRAINIGSVPFSERMMFTRNLSVMVDAGLPISRAMNVLIRQAKNKKFKKILDTVKESVSKGKPLSDSMAEHRSVFPRLYTAMVKSGETSGTLPRSLGLIADQMERDFKLKRKVRGAMMYPAIVVLAMICIGILMLIYVVPTLVSTFESIGMELPASTRLIIWFSNSLVANSIFFVIGLTILIVGFYFFSKTEVSRKMMSVISLKIPIISSLVCKINTARTARTFSALLGSGVDIIESIDVTIEVVQNYQYKKVLKSAKVEIKKGSMISESFKKAEHIYPPLVGEMIAVGEETGKLAEMLTKLADFYESEVNETTKDMATIIEPVLMIFIGGAVGFFAISMIKPMYSMVGGF